jgi:pimeloyl-ACP methyl ester carboxylesterase
MSRRRVLVGSLLISGSSFAGARGGAAPERVEERGTFLLVHGSWHNALQWNAVAAILAGAGHRVLAIDLPGHGLKAKFPEAYLRQDLAALASELSPLKDVTLDDYAAAVVAATLSLARHGRVTLVGHSMGGIAITRAAEAIPEHTRRLVYLASFCPVRVPSLLDLVKLPERAGARVDGLLLGDPKQIGALRINHRSADRETSEGVRQAFYNDVPTDAFLPFAHSLTPDDPMLPLASDARGTRDRWGRVPPHLHPLHTRQRHPDRAPGSHDPRRGWVHPG